MNRVAAGTILTIAGVMIALFLVDRYLERLEQSEVQNQAASLAASATRLLARNQAPEAVVRYQRAHFLVRANREYALGYASALLAAGDLNKAESVIDEQLDANSNDGPANLLMARVLRAKAEAGPADSFYHRAIYGVWPDAAAANRQRVRLELAEWLAQRGVHDELLAELLPLQDPARDNPAVGHKVADLLLEAGTPVRAIEQYRALLANNPDDLAAERGLGEAELKRGNYNAAQRAFMSALRRDGTDVVSARRLQTLGLIVALDPTPRRLPTAEKCQRSGRLLARVKEDLSSCKPAPPPEKSGQTAAKPSVSNETAEMELSEAEQLWRARPPKCPAAQQDDAVKLLMDKLTAQ